METQLSTSRLGVWGASTGPHLCWPGLPVFLAVRLGQLEREDQGQCVQDRVAEECRWVCCMRLTGRGGGGEEQWGESLRVIDNASVF